MSVLHKKNLGKNFGLTGLCQIFFFGKNQKWQKIWFWDFKHPVLLTNHNAGYEVNSRRWLYQKIFSVYVPLNFRFMSWYQVRSSKIFSMLRIFQKAHFHQICRLKNHIWITWCSVLRRFQNQAIFGPKKAQRPVLKHFHKFCLKIAFYCWFFLNFASK